MCTVCGCGAGGLIEAPEADSHVHSGPGHSHPHRHDHGHRHSGDAIDFGAGLAGVSLPGLSQERTIRIERDILSKNAAYAETNRTLLREAGVFALNLLSSPGSGKTTLLVRAIADLQARWPIAVIEGDQQTSRDAERIRATGAQAVQINTGKGCHLDAHMVGHALQCLSLERGGRPYGRRDGSPCPC